MASTLSSIVFLCFVPLACAVTLRSDASKGSASSEAQQQNPCACLPWSEAYSTHGAECGSAYEFGAFGPSQIFQQHAYVNSIVHHNEVYYTEYCNLTWQALPYTSCFNSDFGSVAKQWCYVSKECTSQDLKHVGWLKDVAIKWCSASAGDELQSDKMPEELAVMSNKRAGVDFGRMRGNSSLNLNFVAQLSYPTAAAKFHETGACDGRPTSDAAAKELNDVMASNITTFFGWDAASENGVIVKGPLMWKLIEGPPGPAFTDRPTWIPNPTHLYKRASACEIMADHEVYLSEHVGESDFLPNA